jgi:cytochrome c553
VLLGVLLIASIPAAWAQSSLSLDLKARSLAATCAACHGTDGRSTADDALPRLAARPAAEIANALRAFKSGARPGTVMPQLAKGYDDAQIELLARYFAAQPATTPGGRR